MYNAIIPDPSGMSNPMITNIREKKENNFNINNSQVSFNVTLQQSDNQNEAMLACSRFSREYYQLIVTGENIFDEASRAVTMTTNRSLRECTVPEEIHNRCSHLSPQGIEELKTFPAIITTEKKELYYAEVDPGQMAVFGYIDKIKKTGKVNKIYYRTIGLIPLRVLCENPIDYDVKVNCALSDFNQSAWTVKKVNLFEAFNDTGVKNLPFLA